MDDKDTIYRQAAIELAMQYCPDDDGTCSKADEDIRNLLDELEDLPPAQPRGKWIHYDEGDFDYDYKCSNCGYAVWDDSDFCPGCGADMRGEDNE